MYAFEMDSFFKNQNAASLDWSERSISVKVWEKENLHLHVLFVPLKNVHSIVDVNMIQM